MAYKIKGENGLPIKKDGNYLLGFDLPVMKIEQLDDTNKSFLAIASTEDEDRDNDVIRTSGWDFSNFKKNPVVPWGHDYWEPPVGKAISIKKDLKKKRVVFKPQFDKDDEKAMLIFNKYKNGYLNTFSVGFIGKEYKWRDEDDRWGGGREFIKQELLEISAVTVPANPNANMELRGLESNRPKSLLDEGFKQYMFKSDNGLFLPVSEVSLYTSSKIIQIGKGISAVLAKEIDNPDSEEVITGYIFDNDYDEKTANSWAKQYAPESYKVKYFDLKGELGDEDNVILELVEEESKLEFTDEEKETTETEEKDKTVEEENEDQETKDSNDIEEKETDSTDNDDNNEETKEKTVEDDKSDNSDELKETLKNILEKLEKLSNSISNTEKSENQSDQDSDEFIVFDESLISPDSETKEQKGFIEIDEKDFNDVVKGLDLSKHFESKVSDIFKQTMDSFTGKID